MCAFSITGTAWIVSEKFIKNSSLALLVNIGIAAVIAFLFGKIIESKLNRSIDFLMQKLDRVSNGDLTQRFIEDSQDLLPYGLSFKLGTMMTFFRSKIGGLWRVAVDLIHQIEAFKKTATENCASYQNEVNTLNHSTEHLNQMRQHVTDLSKKIADGKVIMHQHLQFIHHAVQTSAESTTQIKENIKHPKNMRESISKATLLVKNTHTLLKDYQSIGRQISGIQAALAGLASESKLVRLNSDIDISQTESKINPEQVVIETQRILSKVSELAQESGNLTAVLEYATSQILSDLDKESEQLALASRQVTYMESLLNTLNGNQSALHVRFLTLQEDMEEMNDFIQFLDQQYTAFYSHVKALTDRFGKLKVNAQQNLLKFNRMECRLDDIQDALAKLDTFKNQFHIA